MKMASFDGLLKLVGDIHVDFDVSLVVDAAAEHEIEGNRRNDDQHDCDRSYIAAVAVGDCLPPIDCGNSGSPAGAARDACLYCGNLAANSLK
jgi:hypothetical protein